MKKNDVIETIKATVQRHDLLTKDLQAPIVLMVSGGSDSVAMLRFFAEFFAKHNLVVLHVNHLLRDLDSEADENFVVSLAARLGVRCVTRQIDVAALAAKRRENLEQVGRDVRYQQANMLLDELCAKVGSGFACGRIVTAHTLDDRVETFFMRAIVGGGAGALASIPYNNGRVVRPLLDCSRKQLREWLSVVSKPDQQPPFWCEDATNLDTSHLRAFVRHELIPLGQSRNPELLRTIGRSLDGLALDNSLLAQMTQSLTDRFVKEVEGTHEDSGILRIDEALFAEDAALIQRVIHQALGRVLPGDNRITAEHITHIATNGNRVGFVTDIPGAMTVVNEYGTLVVYRREGIGTDASMGSKVLREGHPSQLPDGRTIMLERIAPHFFLPDPVGYARSNSVPSRVFIDGSAVQESHATLRVASVEAGDRFCPLGMKGHHKLVSDVLIDQKIPRRKRQQIAKVSIRRDGKEEIIWITGVLLDDRFKVSEETTSMFSIIISSSQNG